MSCQIFTTNREEPIKLAATQKRPSPAMRSASWQDSPSALGPPGNGRKTGDQYYPYGSNYLPKGFQKLSNCLFSIPVSPILRNLHIFQYSDYHQVLQVVTLLRWLSDPVWNIFWWLNRSQFEPSSDYQLL